MKDGDFGMRGAGFGTRFAPGEPMKWIGGNDYTSIPAWFRLKREGDTVTAYESSDGVKWFLVGKNTVPMPKSYLVGLAVSTGTDKVNTTQFDHVSVTSGGSGEKPAGVNSRN